MTLSAAPRLSVGWPVDPQTRAQIQALVPEFTQGIPYYSESRVFDCCRCEEQVYLGPRTSVLVDSGEAAPVCVYCLVDLKREGFGFDTVSLGNPEDPFAHLPPDPELR